MVLLASLASAQGRFVGELILRPVINPNGPDREMIVVEEFGFIDPNEKKWDVPAGAIVDGASIPRPLWTLIGSPWVGDHRNASVVHDHYCVTKSEPSEKVHRMFYHACIAGGVDRTKSKVMYYAVLWGGPRWEIKKRSGFFRTKTTIKEIDPVELTEDQLSEIEDWVEETDPSLEEIEEKATEQINAEESRTSRRNTRE
jgi:hypothetical protein